MRIAFIIHIVAMLLVSISFANVKKFSPKPDEIIDIKTSLGIATIIHVPGVIQSAIMGDQSAFRIEYVDQAVTIKPLRSGARTNLYLYTKEQRFNLRLSVGPQALAYYIVYINRPDLGSPVRWMVNGKVAGNQNLQVKLNKVGSTSDGFVLLDLNVKALASQKIKASDFWVTQGTDSKVIQSLFMSKTDLKVGQSMIVGLALRKVDLENKDLNIEVRTGTKPVMLIIARKSLWN